MKLTVLIEHHKRQLHSKATGKKEGNMHIGCR